MDAHESFQSPIELQEMNELSTELRKLQCMVVASKILNW